MKRIIIGLIAISIFPSAFASDYCRTVVDATLIENEAILKEIARIEIKTPTDVAKVDTLVDQLKQIESIQLAVKAYCPNY